MWFSKVCSVRQSKEFLDELKFISEEGIRAISILDGDYPELLKNIYDPPPVFFVERKSSEILIVRQLQLSDLVDVLFYGMNMSEKLA